MLVCTDVDYRQNGSARAAALVFRDWPDAAPLSEWVEHVDGVQPYQPGEFYRRELPCLLAVLENIIAAQGVPLAVVIDGYVTLPGRGRHARPGRPPVRGTGPCRAGDRGGQDGLPRLGARAGRLPGRQPEPAVCDGHRCK